MGSGGRAVHLAAGMLSDVPDPVERIRIAAAAGFDGLGLRPEDDRPGAGDPEAVAAALAEHGLRLLDVEVVILTPDDRHAEANRRAVATARALRPAHLVVVSFDTDHARTRAAITGIARELMGTDVVPVLEFLPFSAIRTLAEAAAVATEVRGDGGGAVGVLVDVLHLVRSGGSPTDLATAGDVALPYLQVCDAPATATRGAARGDLFREATGGRLLPGAGGLPIRATVDAMPAGAAVSVEVLSTALMTDLGPAERARAAFDATCAMLSGRDGGEGSPAA